MNRRDFFMQGATVISTKLLDQPALNDLKLTVNALKAQSMQLSLDVTDIRVSIKENMINVNQQIKELKSQQRGLIAAIVTLAILG
jgi:hypothetical protein